MSEYREIACPLSDPLHFADYDQREQKVHCAVCGDISAAELCARVESEWTGIDIHPPLPADEQSVEMVAARLFAAFPADPGFAVELAVAWGAHALHQRLPEDHILLCVERALDRVAA